MGAGVEFVHDYLYNAGETISRFQSILLEFFWHG